MVVKQLAKDSAIYGGADLVSKAISFFTFPFLAKALSPESFGYLELILTSTALLGVLGNSGLNNSVQRYYWDPEVKPEDRKVVVSSGLISQLFLLGIVLVITFGILFFGFPQLAYSYPFTWIGVIASLLLMAGNQWTQYLLDVIRLQFKPWRFLTVSMVSRVISSILGLVIVVYLSGGIDGLLSVQAFVVLAVLPLAVYFIKNEFSLSWFSKDWAKELIRYGYPFIFSALAFWIFTSQDRWMLVSFSSIEEVGIYSVSFRFASLTLFVSAAFGQAWSPLAMKIRADHPDTYPKIYGDILLLLLLAMILISSGIGLFSGEILDLLMGDAYQGSAFPMAILSFAIVFQASQQLTGIGISLEKKTLLFAHLSWITTGINFGLNWILIQQFGATGAAWATLISYLFLTSSYFFFTQRMHPIHLNYYRLSATLALLAGVVFLSIFLHSPEFKWSTVGMKIGIWLGVGILGLNFISFKTLKNV
ncbi:MAG: flippase [Cyclobacteriaceae bacterium]|nr:flippase [Cyclobacteriaceae bacterium]MDX5465403.1 flippase [Cyclobacteriaceae bacterium]